MLLELHQKLEFTDFAHKVPALTLTLPAHITVTENFSILCKYKCQCNKLQNMNIPHHCIHRQHKQQSTISVQDEMEQQSERNRWWETVKSIREDNTKYIRSCSDSSKN